ncbi:MAG: pyridoxamine 5'-phosphate oxidase family protein [Ruminiclostridium sp.]|nr:pyridoxamine 5'-phosphate oxidase family protein [Ruminiclostridium sp.]MBQ9934106.1 pyridoxamine 5'-phosphate oxidase family protein [Ruminiclostridium sp.]
MSKAYEFLKECGAFFVLTINDGAPAGRPFGAVMEVGDDLYLATNDMNQAHKQMREQEKIQIVAKKPDSRAWIRINGVAEECDDDALKERMMEEVPVVRQRFEAVGMEHFLLFKVKVENVEFK